MADLDSLDVEAECPICGKNYPQNIIEVHVNRCIFLNTTSQNDLNKAKESTSKRSFSFLDGSKTNGHSSQSPDNANKKSRTSNSTLPSKSPNTNNNKFRATREELPTTSLMSSKLPATSTVPKPITTFDVTDDEDEIEPSNAFEKMTQKKASTNAKPTTSENAVAKSIPLAEKMRPDSIDDYVGQTHIFGKDAILRKILEKNEVPSMILWGPPGVGKVIS